MEQIDRDGCHDRYRPGTYPRFPAVTWDLAQDRFLQRRRDVVWTWCTTCGWERADLVYATPERRAEAAALAYSEHWYRCPDGSQLQCNVMNRPGKVWTPLQFVRRDGAR